VHKDRGSAKVIDFDGRRVTLQFDRGPHKKVVMDKIIPADISWVDHQIASLKRKLSDGKEVTKSEIQRIVRRIAIVHNLTKPRAKLQTYAEAKRALEGMIGKIQTRLKGDKMGKAEVEAFLIELEDLQTRIPATAKAEWSGDKPRKWASDFRNVRKALVKLRRKANPCIGFHFHGKDADDLLKAVEQSNARTRGVAKKNPTAKRARKY